MKRKERSSALYSPLERWLMMGAIVFAVTGVSILTSLAIRYWPYHPTTFSGSFQRKPSQLPESCSAPCQVFDAFGHTMTVGDFRGTVDFDLGPGEKVFTARGISDVYAAVYDTSAHLLWVRVIGSGGADTGNGCGSGGDTLFVGGAFAFRPTFEEGPPADTSILSSGEHHFITAYDGEGNRYWTKSFGRLKNGR